MSTPFAPDSAPAAGAEPQAPAGAPEGAPTGDPGQQAPAGADPRVLDQMQQQMQQFGGQLEQMANYLPQIAQQHQTGPQEPSLEDQFADWFGMDQNGGFEQQPGQQDQPLYDPYTGEYIGGQQQQPRFDPQTGQPLQQAGPQAPGFGDPNELVNLFREVVRQETQPLHEERMQAEWNKLYEEFPAMNDAQQAPQIAAQVAQAARLFSGGNDAEARRLANDARFARMAYLSSVNQQRGEGETPAGAGDGITPIEHGSSASVQQPAEGDPGDAIVNAGQAAGAGAGAYFR